MYSTDLKNKSVNLYKRFRSYRYVGNLLNIGKSTIHRWVNNISHKISKISINNLVIFIKKLIDSDKFITIKQIKNKASFKFKKKYSLSFIYTIIKNKLKYSYKKVNNKFYNKSVDELRSKQKLFIKNIKNINTNKIICIDETYVFTNFSRDYGWSKKGCPIKNFKKSNPVKYSIIMAISSKKIISWSIYNKNVNKDIFKEFISDLCNQFSNYYFLMDNVSFHKSNEIKNIATNSNNKLLFIPPYSPEFNPIEEVFSQIKRNIHSYNDNLIIDKFKKSIKLVKKYHLKNYYNHSFSNTS